MAKAAIVATGSVEPIYQAATLGLEEVLKAQNSTLTGLTENDITKRVAAVGLNTIRTHRANAFNVLLRQLANPFLILLASTAALSAAFGQVTDAIVIGVILAISVLLGFINEFQAELATVSLHSRIQHQVVVRRNGQLVKVDVTQLVPGDIVELNLGNVVPADIRLVEVNNFETEESILTGEVRGVEKNSAALVSKETPALAELTNCALMGTVVKAGSATGLVVAIGGSTVFGHLALSLSEQQPQTDFQIGLKSFSMLLVKVAASLCGLILVANLILRHPLLDAVLFALAIAVGITPQLLPAVVSTSLARGTKKLAAKKVLVKSLIAIEDLGDMDVLITDKTGTLTTGKLEFKQAISVQTGITDADVIRYGLLASSADYATAKASPETLSELDQALWASTLGSVSVERDFVTSTAVRKGASLEFDHDRRRVTSTVGLAGRDLLVSKGAPEDLMALCKAYPAWAQETLDALYATGARVVAVASRDLSGSGSASLEKPITVADETGLTLAGFLVFTDPAKPEAKASLNRLLALGIDVKIATGDSGKVAEVICEELSMKSLGTLTGNDMNTMDDAALAEAIRHTTIFARVSPEQKSRLIESLHKQGLSVGFLGDGVNDALALHSADVGISVNTATDVAKDAANVVLLDKDLGVLADGVREGRQIFANTMKYVLMGTSSNFGNMFSAASASAFLSFLPMLPGQILLNNLLYDLGQLTIPSDRVDEEQLRKPSHWDIAFIRRFMIRFGPISSIFDFATFAMMLFVFHAKPAEFQAGWFIESLATQTLIIFAIRTRRVPFFRSRPSWPMTISSLAVVTVGAILPNSALGASLGFSPLPPLYFVALAAMTVIYLGCVELAKRGFYKKSHLVRRPISKPTQNRSIDRRATRFSVAPKAVRGLGRPLGKNSRRRNRA